MLRKRFLTLIIFLFVGAEIFAGKTFEEKEKACQATEETTYTLTIASLFRNEARFLKEWIEYHRMLGADHFLLYNHRSRDDYMKVLKPYIDKNIVELKELKEEPKTYQEWKLFHQSQLNTMIKWAKKRTRWLALIDPDEFIVIKKHETIPSFLKEYEEYGGVMLNWQMFGTSNIWRIPDKKLMTATLLYQQEPGNSTVHKRCKSIVNPLRVVSLKKGSTHQCVYKRPFFSVNTKKEPDKYVCTSIFGTKESLIEDACIYHYRVRDEHYLYQERVKRLKHKKYPKETKPENLKILNAVYNPFMLRYKEELKERIKTEPKS